MFALRLKYTPVSQSACRDTSMPTLMKIPIFSVFKPLSSVFIAVFSHPDCMAEVNGSMTLCCVCDNRNISAARDSAFRCFQCKERH